MDAFNNFVANTGFRKLHRGGGQYTWTNKQTNPIMVVLDRFFMNVSQGNHYPLVTAQSITRLGSDHNPLVVEVGANRGVRSTIFRFEVAWTKQEGFREWVVSKWPAKQNMRSIDYWQKISGQLRNSLRGWNGNWGVDMKKRQQDLLLMIKALDQKAEEVSLTNSEWEPRYF